MAALAGDEAGLDDPIEAVVDVDHSAGAAGPATVVAADDTHFDAVLIAVVERLVSVVDKAVLLAAATAGVVEDVAEVLACRQGTRGRRRCWLRWGRPRRQAWRGRSKCRPCSRCGGPRRRARCGTRRCRLRGRRGCRRRCGRLDGGSGGLRTFWSRRACWGGCCCG
jgi:hypothetical protein